MLSPLPQYLFLGTERISLHNTAVSLLLRDHHPAYSAEFFATPECLQPQAEAIAQIVGYATESGLLAVKADLPLFFDNVEDLD